MAKWGEAIEHHIALTIYNELTGRVRAYQLGTKSDLTNEELSKWSSAVEYQVKEKLLDVKIEEERQEINDVKPEGVSSF